MAQQHALVESHMAAAARAASAFYRRLPRRTRGTVSAQDLRSAAYYGLVRAAACFDPAHASGAPFAAYATRFITAWLRRDGYQDDMRQRGWRRKRPHGWEQCATRVDWPGPSRGEDRPVSIGDADILPSGLPTPETLLLYREHVGLVCRASRRARRQCETARQAAPNVARTPLERFVAEACARGLTIRAIAGALGVSRTAVYLAAQRLGLPIAAFRRHEWRRGRRRRGNTGAADAVKGSNAVASGA